MVSMLATSEDHIDFHLVFMCQELSRPFHFKVDIVFTGFWGEDVSLSPVFDAVWCFGLSVFSVRI